MQQVREVTLELLRAGDLHNQLLSQYTPYMALCSGGAPVTFHIKIDHKELLNRLERLRYVTEGSEDTIRISNQMRESEIASLGNLVGTILYDIPGLGSELSSLGTQNTDFVNLRLILSGTELSLIPFELAIAPKGFPGEGMPLAIQTNTPIAFSREVRSRRPFPIRWNRAPRVLFISAGTDSMTVPTEGHLEALKKALAPYVKWENKPDERDKNLRERLTVLRSATLDAIQEACTKAEFTHVHILAHGLPFREGGEERYGLALCSPEDPKKMDVADCRRLAVALRGKVASERSLPSVISLMTCDSGRVGSVLVPGGSIAHELHAHGVPWVFASQFPLTKTGSVTLTEALYDSLLQGVDPRQVLYDVRRRLLVKHKITHDWASLVAYVVTPRDFDLDLRLFGERQTRSRIEVCLDKAERSEDSELKRRAEEEVEAAFNSWKNLLPQDDSLTARELRGEWYGMVASSKKRQAEILHKEDNEERSREMLKKAQSYYLRALEINRHSHWVAIQYLSLSLVLFEEVPDFWWGFSRYCAEQDLFRNDRNVIAWAHGSLAELDMLETARNGSASQKKDALRRVCEHCEAIVKLVGEDSFHVKSTVRQFERYLTWWQRKTWQKIAEAAIAALCPYEKEKVGEKYQLPLSKE